MLLIVKVLWCDKERWGIIGLFQTSTNGIWMIWEKRELTQKSEYCWQYSWYLRDKKYYGYYTANMEKTQIRPLQPVITLNNFYHISYCIRNLIYFSQFQVDSDIYDQINFSYSFSSVSRTGTNFNVSEFLEKAWINKRNVTKQ